MWAQDIKQEKNLLCLQINFNTTRLSVQIEVPIQIEICWHLHDTNKIQTNMSGDPDGSLSVSNPTREVEDV